MLLNRRETDKEHLLSSIHDLTELLKNPPTEVVELLEERLKALYQRLGETVYCEEEKAKAEILF